MKQILYEIDRFLNETLPFHIVHEIQLHEVSNKEHLDFTTRLQQADVRAS